MNWAKKRGEPSLFVWKRVMLTHMNQFHNSLYIFINTNFVFKNNSVTFHFIRLLSPQAQVQHLFKLLSVAFTVFSLPRTWPEPPRKKITSCGVSRLMGLTTVRPPKCICLSRRSQPNSVQGNYIIFYKHIY